MNRRLLQPVALLALGLSVPLAACGQQDEPPADAATTYAPEASPPTSTAPAPVTPSAGGMVTASGLVLDIPAGWGEREPGPMRAAELTVPTPEGTEGGAVAFFDFGPRGAGDADANIARWASLVLDADGNPAAPAVAKEEHNGLTISFVELEGTYMDGPPGGDKTAREGWALYGAILEGGPNPLYVRMTGPRELLAAQRDAWITMIRSARAAAN